MQANNVKTDIKDYGKEQPARWLSIDPAASKYPGWSPYNYALNNPLNIIDPNGDSIWVGTGNDRVYYQPGMKYSGDNKDIAAIISSLNTINSTEIGKEALTTLISSEGNYDYNLGSLIEGAGGTFSGNSSGLGGSINLLSSQLGNIEEVAHESFHAYMFDQGSGGSSISNEVQAYLFGAAVSMSTNSSPQFFGLAGSSYDNTMWKLMGSNKFDLSSFKNAVEHFKNESSANAKGTYNKCPPYRSNEKYLIGKLFPLLR